MKWQQGGDLKQAMMYYTKIIFIVFKHICGSQTLAMGVVVALEAPKYN
jgi:hypothetical protein